MDTTRRSYSRIYATFCDGWLVLALNQYATPVFTYSRVRMAVEGPLLWLHNYFLTYVAGCRWSHAYIWRQVVRDQSTYARRVTIRRYPETNPTRKICHERSTLNKNLFQRQYKIHFRDLSVLPLSFSLSYKSFSRCRKDRLIYSANLHEFACKKFRKKPERKSHCWKTLANTSDQWVKIYLSRWILSVKYLLYVEQLRAGKSMQ